MRRLLAGAFLAIAIAGCSPKVEVEGGGQHPFPDWIVKLDQQMIQEKKTGVAKYKVWNGDVLDDRFVHRVRTGAQLVQDKEKLVDALEQAINAFNSFLKLTKEGTEKYQEVQNNISRAETDLEKFRGELEQARDVTQQDDFIDCVEGWWFTVQLLKDGDYRRQAKEGEAENLRSLCETAALKPGF